MITKYYKGSEDIVMTSSFNRPHILFDQVISFLENMLLFSSGYRSSSKLCNSKMPEKMYRLRKIIFCVVNDSDPIYDVEYLNVIKKINRWIKNNELENYAFVDFWSKNRQIDFLEKRGELKNLNKKRIRDMFSDVGGKKYGGIRGICNISRAVGIYVASLSINNPTLHFVDSDIFPFVMWKDGLDLKISHLYYFFGHKEWILSNPKIKLTGAYYTVDSPSPIIDLYEALWFIEMFFSTFEKSNIDDADEWFKFANKLIWIGKRLIYENVSCNTLISEPLIFSTGTFRLQLPKVTELIDILLKGNNRFVFNTANFSKTSNWHGKRDNFANGCISMKLSEALKLKPYPLFGNQELILYPYEYAISGDTFWGDFDVSHIKEPAGRLSLFEDLEIKNKKYRQKHDFKQLAEISSYLEKYKGIKYSKNITLPRRRFKDDVLKYAIYGESIMVKIEKTAKNIIILCNNSRQKDQLVTKIASRINDIITKLPNVYNQYDITRRKQEISNDDLKLLNFWLDMFSDWNKFVAALLKTN